MTVGEIEHLSIISNKSISQTTVNQDLGGLGIPHLIWCCNTLSNNTMFHHTSDKLEGYGLDREAFSRWGYDCWSWVWHMAVNFPKISQHIMALYLDYTQLRYISLTLSFAFGPSESLPQDFGHFRNGSKFLNFEFGDGKIWKSQYCIYIGAG